MKNALYFLLVLLPALAQGQTVAPDVLVKTITDEVTAVIKKDKDIQSGDTRKAADLIESKIVPHFNFTRMARLAMGRNWSSATPEQQKELASEFKTLLVRTYSTAITNYRDQQIDYNKLRAKPDVQTTNMKSAFKPTC